MSPDQFRKEASSLYGNYWIAELSRELKVNRSTLHRILHRNVIPEKYVYALNWLKIGVAKRHR